jgi:hypothetical protein
MGKDNQSRVRQANKLKRKSASRSPAERILIVTEGSKTEPLYLKEIRVSHKLSTANVSVHHSGYGTCPLNIVNYALDLFKNGSIEDSVNPKAFEKVFVVFDRDEHQKYFSALEKVQSNAKKLKNDLREVVELKAIVNVPCFELWLLLHYEEVKAPIHRHEAYQRLKTYLQNYDKGCTDTYSQTRKHYEKAKVNAMKLSEVNTPWTEPESYTNVFELVDLLVNLNNKN